MIDIYSDIFLIFFIFQGYFADQFRFILYVIHAAISLLQLILACLVDKRPFQPDTQENKRVPVFIVCFGYVTALSHGVNSLGRTYGELPYHPGPLSIKLLCSACEVLVVKDTKGEQRTFKPQAHRKPDVKLYT